MREHPLAPMQLAGTYITLKRLAETDLEDLLEAGKGVDCSWMSSSLDSREAMYAWIMERMHDASQRRGFTFTVVLNSTGRAVGSSTYLDIREKDRGVEIGRTWYSPSAQGTQVNAECKYLLLRHAFQEWGALRVQLKTDNRNAHSQNALRKLGAIYEGELRNHVVRRDGTIRHTRLYSITVEEWPEVRQRLEGRLK